MKTTVTMVACCLTAGLLSTTSAVADTTAVATTDLNLRSGPGPEYSPIAVIGNGESAVIEGCLNGSKWCQVSYNGTTGWAYSDYLAMATASSAPSGTSVIVTERRDEVPVVTYDNPGDNALIGAAGGAAAGALVGGPVGAAIGGIAGASAGAISTPPPSVRTYVTQNRSDTVYLEDVTVGTTVPGTVQLQPVPNSQYEYVYVNEQPVLVEPNSRRIVYVY